MRRLPRLILTRQGGIAYALLSAVVIALYLHLGFSSEPAPDVSFIIMAVLFGGGICTLVVLLHALWPRANTTIRVLYCCLFFLTIPLTVVISCILFLPIWVMNLVHLIRRDYDIAIGGRSRLIGVVLVLIPMLIVGAVFQSIEDNYRGTPALDPEVAFSNQFKDAATHITIDDPQGGLLFFETSGGRCSRFVQDDEGFWALDEKLTTKIERETTSGNTLYVFRSKKTAEDLVVVCHYSSDGSDVSAPTDSLGSTFAAYVRSYDASSVKMPLNLPSMDWHPKWFYFYTIVDYDADGYEITPW